MGLKSKKKNKKRRRCNWDTKLGGSAERTKEEDLLVSFPSKPLISYLVLLFLFDKLMGPSHCIPTWKQLVFASPNFSLSIIMDILNLFLNSIMNWKGGRYLKSACVAPLRKPSQTNIYAYDNANISRKQKMS